jgi:rubredoxin
MHASGAFFNENTAAFRCDQCGAIVQGTKGANEHGKATGHINFSQANM